jgi:hypothetical protein
MKDSTGQCLTELETVGQCRTVLEQESAGQCRKAQKRTYQDHIAHNRDIQRPTEAVPDSFGISKDAFLIHLKGAPCMKRKRTIES